MATPLAQRFPRNHYIYRGMMSDTNPSPSPKRPRGDCYVKLIHRFYEALILLYILGQTRALRDVNPGPASTSEERRRRLLRNLAYLCDYKKGGETTAAIALGEEENGFTFWVASNSNESNNNVIIFLNSILAEIRTIIRPVGNQRVLSGDELTWICIDFAKARVKKEITILERAIRSCRKRLDLEKNEQDGALWKWLEQFLEKPYVNTCFLAYRERKAPQMRYMESKIVNAHEQQTPSEMSSGFDNIRHSIGRLAHHIRAPRQVIEDFSKLEGLLDTYSVRHIPQVANITAPKADDHTTLQGIIGRMFPSNNNSLLREYEENLPIMNQKLSLQEKFMEQYNNPNFKPIVHAEIRVLEYFYGNDLVFAGKDRFIGCSRPACYCCQLYIQHHPLRCVKPEAHYKIWLNWGPPALPKGANDPKYKHQRDILNKMIPELRREALDQLTKKAGPFAWHPDSFTGVTQSEASERRKITQFPSLEIGFETLRIDSPDPSTSDNEDNRSSSPEYSSLSSVRADGFSSQESEASSLDDDSDDDPDVEGGVSLC